MTEIDGKRRGDNLVGSPRALRATTMALTNLRNELASVERLAPQTSELRDSARIAPPPPNTRMNVTTRCPRRQTLGLSAIAYGLRLVRTASNVILARFQKAPTIIRNIIVRVERGFADFAQIPYEDPIAQRALLLLLDEFAAECDPDHSTGAESATHAPIPQKEGLNTSGEPERRRSDNRSRNPSALCDLSCLIEIPARSARLAPVREPALRS